MGPTVWCNRGIGCIGTKASVPILSIESLADDNALVALEAVSLLRVLCDHRRCQLSGEAGANGIPPVPVAIGSAGNDDQTVLSDGMISMLMPASMVNMVDEARSFLSKFE